MDEYEVDFIVSFELVELELSLVRTLKLKLTVLQFGETFLFSCMVFITILLPAIQVIPGCLAVGAYKEFKLIFFKREEDFVYKEFYREKESSL